MHNPGKAYKVKANDFIFSLDEQDIAEIDLWQKSLTEFNCIYKHRSINAVLIEADRNAKQFKISIEGEIFSIEIKDELDQMIDTKGLNAGGGKKHINIKAPMPGLVLEIAVTTGQQVNEGDKILILQAMKMENSIVVPANATIKEILVATGDVVERGQVLVELE